LLPEGPAAAFDTTCRLPDWEGTGDWLGTEAFFDFGSFFDFDAWPRTLVELRVQEILLPTQVRHRAWALPNSKAQNRPRATQIEH